jgi:hypothetical protein
MEGDGIGGWAHWLRRRLDTAFLCNEGWDELRDKADGYLSTQRWLAGIADVETQVAVRWLLPDHHSTAALDTALGRVRDFLDARSFVCGTSAEPTSRSTSSGSTSTAPTSNGGTTRCCETINEHGGQLPRQRAGKDTGAGPRTAREDRVPASLRV